MKPIADVASISYEALQHSDDGTKCRIYIIALINRILDCIYTHREWLFSKRLETVRTRKNKTKTEARHIE